MKRLIPFVFLVLVMAMAPEAAIATTFTQNSSGNTAAVGSLAITGGSSGYMLYDNAGKLGERAITGSGDVVLATGGAIDLSSATGLPLSTGATGLLGLAHGGLNLDLTATGGANYVVQQTSSGGSISVGQLSLGSLSDVVKNNPSNNLLLGTGAGGSLTSGTNNTALGYPALSVNTSGGWNVAVGSNSLIANTTATDNIAVGDSTLKAVTTGYENTAVGSGAMQTNIAGVQNTAIGGFAMYAATGSYLTAVGDAALNSCTTCANTTAVGYAAGNALTTGGANTVVGHDALFTDIIGADNTAVGNIALLLETGGTSTAIGSGALDAATTGSANTALGYLAGAAVTTGASNVLIGSGADVSAGAATNRIAIGQGVTNSTDNTVSIGNSSITDVHFGNDTAILHGNGSALTGISASGSVTRLYANTATAGNAADATEDTIFTYTIPANTLASNGDKIRVQAYCRWATNAHTKTIKMYFGAVIPSSVGPGTNSNFSHRFDVLITKTGSNTQAIDGWQFSSNSNSTAGVLTGITANSGVETDTSGIVIKITGQSSSSAANDVTCTNATVEFISH